jgi:hypothetical protein
MVPMHLFFSHPSQQCWLVFHSLKLINVGIINCL